MSRFRERRLLARRRIIALAAAGGVVVASATITSLAAWLDEEWVVAGVGGAPGVAASEFEIEQQVGSDPSGVWFNRESEGVAGVVDLDDVAQSLSPGVVAYGWVSLRAAADSVGGTLTVIADYADGDSLLGDVLRYGATLHADPSTCTSGGYASGTQLVATGSPLDVGSGSTSFSLPAGTAGSPGTASTVCFRIEFPSAAADDALQGLTASLVWHFQATSE